MTPVMKEKGAGEKLKKTICRIRQMGRSACTVKHEKFASMKF
jgi:hypothetical protein